jgi:hypothetical protein
MTSYALKHQTMVDCGFRDLSPDLPGLGICLELFPDAPDEPVSLEQHPGVVGIQPRDMFSGFGGGMGRDEPG